MSGKKCKHCGSSEIEVDPARGDIVCTSCGTVLEDNIIVAEIEFQENAHGGASTLGQFVSSESKGGATGFGGAFTMGIGQESREITLRKAREGITALCQQLRLSQQCIDIACNFFKMALSRHLTIGRPASHTRAACVYMTCRTEGTPHLLIDISDALQICCYQLGRTYYKLSKALCISIPPTDPCLYILRFVSQLKFEDKSHDVSMTALRLVQRMKRDSIHSGRRPSGICGAALLIAARLHNFSRTPADVVRIVKVHETTLRKRMMEFGETPSSSLTVDEFMTVDLEEEQDPPAFRAARKRDKERLQKLLEEEDGEKEMTELQKEIERHLKSDNSKKRKAHTARVLEEVPAVSASTEDSQAEMFAAQDTLGLIDEITKEIHPNKGKLQSEKGLAPDLAVIGLGQQPERKPEGTFLKPEPKPHFGRDLHSADELVMSEKDEVYLDALIMSEEEARHKSFMWNKINAGYLKEQKIKRELKEKELEEGKDKKRKIRGSYKKKTPCNAATAGEAVEKMLAEKRFSMKIDYDILKTLDQSGSAGPPATPARDAAAPETSKSETSTINVPESPVPRKRKKAAAKLPASPKTGAKPARTTAAPGTPKRLTVAPSTPSRATPVPSTPSRSTPAPATPAPVTPARVTPAPATPAPDTPAIADAADYDDYMDQEAAENEELSLGAMLRNGQDDDDYYDDDY